MIMINVKGRNRHSWMFLVALVIIYASYAALIYNHGINLFGEGSVLGDAQGIIQGKVLYRDISTVYAPGQFYLLAWLFDIFGENILVAHVMWLSVRFVGLIILFYLCRRIMPDLFVFLVCLLYTFVSGPWFKVFFSFFNIPVVLSLIHYSDRREKKWLVAAGLFCGLGIIFRQDTGLFMLVLGLLTILLAEGRNLQHNFLRVLKSAGYFVVPAAALILPVAVYFYWQGALGDLYYWCFRWAIAGEHILGLPFPNILNIPDPDLAAGWDALHGYLATKLFYYIPLFILFIVLVQLIVRFAFRRSSKEDLYIAIIFLWGCMLSYKDIMVPIYRHAIQAALPVYVLGCYLLSLMYTRTAGKRINRAVAVPLLVIVLVIPLFIVYHHLVYADDMQKDYMKWQPGQVVLDIARAPVYADREDGKSIEQVTKYIIANTDKNDYIFADTVPGFYFLTGRRNASRYEVLQPLIFSRGSAEEEALVDTLRVKAKYIIHANFSLKRRRLWEYKDFAPLVSRFIMDECIMVKQVGPYQVYRNARL